MPANYNFFDQTVPRVGAGAGGDGEVGRAVDTAAASPLSTWTRPTGNASGGPGGHT